MTEKGEAKIKGNKLPKATPSVRSPAEKVTLRETVHAALALLPRKDLTVAAYYEEGCRIIAKHLSAFRAAVHIELPQGAIEKTWISDPQQVAEELL